MILTSNRDVGDGLQAFDEPVVSNITIDRIFDRAASVIFKGQSYRPKGRIKIKAMDLESIKH